MTGDQFATRTYADKEIARRIAVRAQEFGCPFAIAYGASLVYAIGYGGKVDQAESVVGVA